MALTDKLSAIGDAIRTKTGSTDLLTLDAMPTAIESITTATEPNLEELSVTANGIYIPTESDGYSKVTVNVEGGADSYSSLWSNGTWEEISAVLTSYYNGEITDLSPYFRVGDTRDISTSAINEYGGVSGSYVCAAREAETMPWVIIGIQHDDLATATEAGVTKAAITIIPYYNYSGAVYWYDAYGTSYSSISNPNICSLWANSQVREWLRNMFMPAIQEECRNLIKTVTKNTARDCSKTSSYNYIKTYSETVWLLSVTELTGKVLLPGADGVHYEWFKNEGNGNATNRIRYSSEESASDLKYQSYGLRNGQIYYSSGYRGYCYYYNTTSYGTNYGTYVSTAGGCPGMCL